jgi:hypothetical protein
MQPVAVRIFHAEAATDAGPLTRLLANARRRLADRHAAGFTRLGRADVQVVSDLPDDTRFGARLRRVAPRGGGLISLGSGAVPLATAADLQAFIRAAQRDGRFALANNRYSADVVAVSDASVLSSLPDLPADNALPRWLSEVCGFEVADLARRWRLQIDYDSPLDVLIADRREEADAADAADAIRAAAGSISERIAAVSAAAADPRAEILVAGRTSTATLRWLERRVPARTRALVEERGLRASSALAVAGGIGQRPPRSLLGHLLDADGVGSLGAIVADVADAAIIDTRVLLAHRLGADERAWPDPEDRYASDLLQPDGIADPWLRTLTDAAQDSPVPILLGGHTLVGPGLRLVLRQASAP